MFGLLRLAQPVLLSLEPERAHELSLAALRSGLPLVRRPPDNDALHVRIAGLDLPNPLGMAAGYDKNGEVPQALLRLGFGFAEVGTVTPLPQAGNPSPRIFRLPRDKAVINRLGFNNQGHAALAERLAAHRGPGIVGVNIGANKDSADRIADYELGIRTFAPLASYLTANISSPNTPGLRSLQTRSNLAELLGRMVSARASINATTPIFLKIAPDIAEPEMDDIAAEVAASAIDGLIVSNTTLSRQGLREGGHESTVGGLSGRPLFARSTAVLARMRLRLGQDFPIIGAGGIDTVEAALEKMRAGADLIQLYTGMIFAGPGLPSRIVRGMAAHVRREGLGSIREIRDTRVEHWATHPLA